MTYTIKTILPCYVVLVLLACTVPLLAQYGGKQAASVELSDAGQTGVAVVGEAAFGDSSLNFAVRCCISGPDKRLATSHQLQFAINKQLTKHNVVIPFPQRVLHCISADQLRPAI